ncbi:Oidioi.mRNA.OKI2018_I69.XSR.g16894.t1.cds [Oikopleura dioica]|uniref:Oidioi.mRNA.OKI2018_I69.XSR.g16894.t1.cds n=1 Tax=Oikopleura dioica TaxID=34765 RepID=A0ABN7SHK0_OIKDI|nr:Oidioi.mRNA.OKI2018_I69.XSR.g16894.t1.cds [Oikopleura dioica]
MKSSVVEEERAAIEALIGKFKSAEIIQLLWKGFGAIYRVQKEDGSTVILKHFNFAHETEPEDDPMPNETRFLSFKREISFYEELANLSLSAKVPRYIASKDIKSGKVMAMEDLDPIGFPARFKNRCNLSFERVIPMVKWLANFHADFWRCEKAEKLMWKEATYWNIEKRRDEFERCKEKELDLIKLGEKIDRIIHEAKHKTLIHGDGKVENFCFSEDGMDVAGIDFQWSGMGVGTTDLYYLLTSCYEEFSRYDEIVDEYFKFFRKAMEGKPEVDEIEREWRWLWPFIVADFERFLITWNPTHWKRNEYSAQQSKIAVEMIRNSSNNLS